MTYSSFKGSIEVGGDEVISPSMRKDGIIKYLIITNKQNNQLFVNIFIQPAKSEYAKVFIAPKNFQLAQGECYTDRDIVIEQGEKIVVGVTGGEADYHFSIEMEDK